MPNNLLKSVDVVANYLPQALELECGGQILLTPYAFGNCQFLGLYKFCNLVYQYEAYNTPIAVLRNELVVYLQENNLTIFPLLFINVHDANRENVEQFFGTDSVYVEFPQFTNTTGSPMYNVLIGIDKFKEYNTACMQAEKRKV